MVQHLEHLLFYGADMNARNASGNTPLHVCAVNNQDSAARMLLFRGADKECLNFAGQTAYQVRLSRVIESLSYDAQSTDRRDETLSTQNITSSQLSDRLTVVKL